MVVRSPLVVEANGSLCLGCPEWRPWTSYWIVNYFIYIFYAVCIPTLLVSDDWG